MAYSIEKKQNGLLLFTIERSEKRNAVNYEVMEGLEEALSMAAEIDVKAFAITGSGDLAFCSGGDLSVFHLLETKEEAYSMLSKMANILYRLFTLPKPTVAILNGTAVGGGCEIAAACDFRIARRGIKAGFIQGKQAIITGWGGASMIAEKLAAPAAMKLLMSADVYPADELAELGFIDKLYEGDPHLACETFLSGMLHIDLKVLQSFKEVWLRKWETEGLAARIEEEVKACSLLWEGEAHHSQVSRFIGKKE